MLNEVCAHLSKNPATQERAAWLQRAWKALQAENALTGESIDGLIGGSPYSVEAANSYRRAILPGAGRGPLGNGDSLLAIERGVSKIDTESGSDILSPLTRRTVRVTHDGVTYGLTRYEDGTEECTVDDQRNGDSDKKEIPRGYDSVPGGLYKEITAAVEAVTAEHAASSESDQ